MVETNLLQMEEAAKRGLLAPRVPLGRRRRRAPPPGRYPLGAFPVLSGIRRGLIHWVELDTEELWKTWARLLRDKEGDCEEVVTSGVAEMIWNGIPAQARAYPVGVDADGYDLWHVSAWLKDPRRGRWRWGDLSRMAGMA